MVVLDGGLNGWGGDPIVWDNVRSLVWHKNALYLAGDYTRTGWPATMECAVRSGYLAAEAVLRQAGIGSPDARLVRSDLKAQWPARLLGLGR